MNLAKEILISLLIPTAVFLNLFWAPFTKVEESFGMHAVHDISTHGIPFKENFTRILSEKYDHSSFPGSVPRTFVGPLVLGGLAGPVAPWIQSPVNKQIFVRGILACYNSISLIFLGEALDTAFGRSSGSWFALFQATQFRINYYASRTLPNMFAFGLTTVALGMSILGFREEPFQFKMTYRLKMSLSLLTFVAVVFRSEISLLMIPVAFSGLLQYMSLRAHHESLWSRLVNVVFQILCPAISIGLISGLLISLPIDSLMWSPAINRFQAGSLTSLFSHRLVEMLPTPIQTTLSLIVWPELSAFFFNTVLGHSADWGVEPWHTYFSRELHKLLINPIFPLLIGCAVVKESRCRHLFCICLAHIGLMSFLGHKEWRFISYDAPALTAIAAVGAAHLVSPENKKVSQSRYKAREMNALRKAPPELEAKSGPSWRILFIGLLILGSTLVTWLYSLFSLGVSRLNYPGGMAVTELQSWISSDQLHMLASKEGSASLALGPSGLYPIPVNVYASNLVCQTGLTSFLVGDEPIPFKSNATRSWKLHVLKNDDSSLLESPEYVSQLDFALLGQSDQPSLGLQYTTRSRTAGDTESGNAPTLLVSVGSIPFRVIGSVSSFDRLRILRPGSPLNRGFLVPLLASIYPKSRGSSCLSAPLIDGLGNSAQSLEPRVDELCKALLLTEDWIRQKVTRGYWLEISTSPKVYILKRA